MKKKEIMEVELSGVVDNTKLQQQQDKDDLHDFHVLAVDDSLIDRKLLEKLLLVSSCKVTCVDSGDKALKYLGLLDHHEHHTTAFSTSSQSHDLSNSPLSLHQHHHHHHHQGMKVNLIMTDYCMPGMSGYDLLKRVKGSSWKDVPVVIMSSENVPSRISMCLEGGAEEFLLKPLKLSDLKKLQPYLVKSLNNNNNNNTNNNNNNNDNNDNDKYNREEESGKSSVGSENKECNNNKSNNCIAKRKAMSPDDPSDRSRPKIKGLAVL